ncbi:splicing factor, suppressor of white-apricot homolog isoform X1 [Patella vulgata]|uniref:splicing factor, suppressor of white-apricot homolog isoform X1 n=2 Tax=Patella vulgata TaxID=6465 RepID=UPI0024A92B2D|nr:splicing factor, suppressor of white-apricot homolog isoform X1 [Patella vulgata]
MAAQLWLDDENSSHSQSSKDDVQDLFVFGYACKVFRNDEKALYVDKGKHLIPWMGDERLMIDRYDGRGHLYDLKSVDADNVAKKDLTDEEEQIEKLCDEERYLELNTDIAEKTVYEEEEWKRYYEALQTGYNAVGFSYEQPRHEDDIYHQDVHQPEEEKPFIPPPGLCVPIHLELPATVKINAVIEKTAKFIAEHGAQMEIVLKAKQAGNSQFDFLDYNGPLNGYYKFMVSIIKSGKYVPKSDAAEIQRQESHEGYDHHEHGYLHKSLDTTKVEPVKSVKIPVVSIHDTPYGQLIKSIKKHHRDEAESTNSSLQPPPLPPYTQQPYHDREDSGHDDVQTYGNDGNRQSPAPPGTEPVDLPRQHVYLDNMSQLKSEEVNPIIPPPPDIQPIIDRMAMYVAKNGSEFEMVVKSKNDARFQFLNDWHVHFPYYDFRKNLHQKEILKEKKQKEEATAALLSKGVSFSIKTRTKEPESVAPLKKPLFDYGSSDDNDDESDSQKETSVASSPRTDRTDNSNNNKQEVNTDSNTGYMSSDPLDEVDDKKIAEDRLMNRLASAAREKLAQTSKEKQIQAERKRKAAMFISLLKGKNGSGPDENEKKTPVVFDYGHKSLGSKSQSPISDNRGVSPPKSFSKIRRSRSRSPVRKNSYYSSSSSRKSRSPYVSRQRTPRTSPKRRSRTPRISPKRSRSPKHKSPRISPRRSKSPSKSRSEHRSSRSKSRSDDRSSRSRYTSRRHSRSKEKSVSEKSKIEIPPSETIESLKLMIKQEKLDPIFDKASNTNISLIDNSILNTDHPSDNSEHISNIVMGQTEKSTDSENSKLESNDVLSDVEEKNKKISETDNDPQTTDNIPPPIDKPEPPPEESDDDIAIIEPPPKILPEPELVVDLTVVIDSDSDNEKKSSKKSKNAKKRKSRSRSPVAKKKYRRSRSPTYSRPRRRSPSPLPPRRRRSRSKTPKRRSRSRSIAKKSRHATYKTSKKHRSRSRSPTKHRKQRSPSPKRKSRSRSPIKKTSRYKSKSRSPRSKRSRTPKVKKSKKNKSPSRSPKLHKKKKNKDKDREREEGGKSKEKTSAFKSLAEVVESHSKKDKLEERLETKEETDNTKYSIESNETSQDVPYELTSSPAPPTNLLNKVRAMLKASRDAMKDDEDVR